MEPEVDNRPSLEGAVQALPALSLKQKLERSKMKLAIAITILIIVIVCVFVYIVPGVRNTLIYMWVAVTLSPELEQFSLAPLPTTDEGWVTYKKKGLGFVTEGSVSHALVPEARVPGHVVEVEGMGVTINLDGKPIFKTTSVPLQLALSKNGEQVAFVQKVTQRPSDNVTPEALNELMRTYAASAHVYVIDVDIQASRDLGIGYSPVFLDDTHVLRLTSDSMVITDLTTWVDTKVLDGSFDTFRPLITSQDMSKAVFQANDIIHMYTLTSTTVLETATISTIKGIPTALTNDTLYTIVASERGSDVWAYALLDGSGRHVQHFPNSFKIIKLIP